MDYKFNVLYQKDDHGYYVFCPELKGCHSQGESFEEAKQNIKEAIKLYLDTMDEEELKELSSSKELISSTMEVSLV